MISLASFASASGLSCILMGAPVVCRGGFVGTLGGAMLAEAGIAAANRSTTSAINLERCFIF
jgi:hypothetical protein